MTVTYRGPYNWQISDVRSANTHLEVELADAVRQVLTGEIVDGPAVAGLLAAHAVLAGIGQPRPADAPWPDRPTRFADRA